ncbi:MAG: hypothetical protein AC479_02920 [miscellaneous Crenarchaeota group-6 archaeon AD8-1]|nr:MAG: hypothetical protein AC479_02920 [miscellaneous Crenarchaeota group-6 archaeon AD8-1]
MKGPFIALPDQWSPILNKQDETWMKIKCVKLQCPVCNKSGSCQLFMNKANQVRYARVRHYSHLDKVSKN